MKGKPSKVFRKLCSSDFSCDHRVAELKKRGKNKRHSNYDAKFEIESVKGNETVTTEENFVKAEDVKVRTSKIKNAAMVVEAKLSNLIATYNIPLWLFDCLAESSFK